jgi:hypothetical protein
MENKPTDHDFEDISGLIRKEEEDALAFFRAKNFRDRVEIRVKEEAGGEKPPLLFRRKAVPFLAAALVLIMAGALIFILKRSGAGPPSEFEALASALGRLPGFSHPLERGWAVSTGQTGTSRLADSIRRALATGEQIKKEEEQRISIPAGTGKVPRLSLDQKMEILFQEKAIERALQLFRNGSKEV